MKIFLDTADVSMISPAYETGLLDGVTTNPTLILKSGRQLQEVIEEISNSFSNLESISAEVVADTAEEMLSQAQKFYTIAPAVTIKVPCTVEGLKTCKFLTDKGIQVNVTLVFSPFVGRWMDNSVDGIELIKNIRKAFDYSGTSTQILAASLRDVRQVEQSALSGADVVTIPPIVFWAMYKNIMTDKGLELFQKDWESVLENKNEI
jgi:transaldolase